MSETTIPRKWEILPLDHPTVLRRLVKELNANGWQAGRTFYSGGMAFTMARFHKGKVQVRMAGQAWYSNCRPELLPHCFYDGAGQPITASRTRCGH